MIYIAFVTFKLLKNTSPPHPGDVRFESRRRYTQYFSSGCIVCAALYGTSVAARTLTWLFDGSTRVDVVLALLSVSVYS